MLLSSEAETVIAAVPVAPSLVATPVVSTPQLSRCFLSYSPKVSEPTRAIIYTGWAK